MRSLTQLGMCPRKACTHYPVLCLLCMHHVSAVNSIDTCLRVRADFQGQCQTEVCTSMDMAEHLVYPNTADAVS